MRTLAFWLLLAAFASGARAECSTNVSLGTRNQYRGIPGPTVVDSPILEANVGTDCGRFGGYIWGAHNTDSGRLNEWDVGVGYSLGGKKLSGRVAIDRWFLEEAGLDENVLKATGTYSGPATVRGGVFWQVDGGTQTSLSVGKTFPLGRKATATPNVETVCTDGFIGVTGCNMRYGVNWSAPLKDGLSINVRTAYDRANGTVGLQPLENGTDFRVGLTYTLGKD